VFLGFSVVSADKRHFDKIEGLEFEWAIWLCGRNRFSRITSLLLSSTEKERCKMTKNIKPIFTITNRITAGLTRIERARGFLEAAALSEDWVRKMGRCALILDQPLGLHLRQSCDIICDRLTTEPTIF
jgi:hypothetical protein